ncbi:hypothetical protein GCM10020001_072360 [Nonomuraea salmonea]
MPATSSHTRQAGASPNAPKCRVIAWCSSASSHARSAPDPSTGITSGPATRSSTPASAYAAATVSSLSGEAAGPGSVPVRYDANGTDPTTESCSSSTLRK